VRREVEESLNDRAEAVIEEATDAGDTDVAYKRLRCKAKDRGWVEKLEEELQAVIAKNNVLIGQLAADRDRLGAQVEALTAELAVLRGIVPSTVQGCTVDSGSSVTTPQDERSAEPSNPTSAGEIVDPGATSALDSPPPVE
jgi:hypothetical protein